MLNLLDVFNSFSLFLSALKRTSFVILLSKFSANSSRVQNSGRKKKYRNFLNILLMKNLRENDFYLYIHVGK